MKALVVRAERLRDENGALRGQVDEQQRRIDQLDGKLLEANQARRDIGKRIDQLIAQIDQLDAQLATLDD